MKPEDFENDPNCQMISQPLLTEDGFLNEACINELNSAIKNMPKTHERLSGNEEWNSKRITHFRNITAGLAYWAIKQLSSTEVSKQDAEPAPAYPPNLEKVIGYLHACIRPKFDKSGYAQLSLCDVNKMLHDILYEQNISVFDEWNTKEVLGSHWLDLDALLHNVCLTIRQDRRDFDRFNKEFEEKWSKMSVDIIVNGKKESIADNHLFFEQIVELAGKSGTPTVVYRYKDGGGGVLIPGVSIAVKKGMIIDVIHTGDA